MHTYRSHYNTNIAITVESLHFRDLCGNAFDHFFLCPREFAHHRIFSPLRFRPVCVCVCVCVYVCVCVCTRARALLTLKPHTCLPRSTLVSRARLWSCYNNNRPRYRPLGRSLYRSLCMISKRIPFTTLPAYIIYLYLYIHTYIRTLSPHCQHTSYIRSGICV